MRIMHVIARMNIGGTASWINTLSRELALQGHDVVVALGSVQSGETEDSSMFDLPHQRLPRLGRKVAPIDDAASVIEIRNFIEEWQPDLVNTHTAKAGVVGRVAARTLGRRRPALVHTIHGHLLAGYFNPSTVRAISAVERVLASATDILLAPGPEVTNELAVGARLPSSKLRSVLPGVPDFARVSSQEARSALGHAELGSGRPVVGWLGRLTAVKRPDRLLEVARLVPHARFLVGGDGPDRMALESDAPPNVNFLGWTTPETFWSACDIGLLTSDNEAIPYSIIEAQLAGVPVIASRVGGVASAVVDGETGFLAEPHARSLARALDALIGDSSIRTEMGRAGRFHALATFAPRSMADRHLEVYREALAIRG